MIENSLQQESGMARDGEATGLEAVKRSPWTVGLLLFAVLLFYFWLSGAIFAKDMSGFYMTSAQTTGMCLTYSTSPAFMFAALVYAQRRTRANVDQLVASGIVDPDASRMYGLDSISLGRARNLMLTILGLFLGSTNVSWDHVYMSLGGPWTLVALSIAVGNLITWIAVVQVVTRRVIASNALRKLGRDHVQVDLLRPDRLLPFGRIAILHLLMVAVSISLSAFQSLDAELRWVNYSSAFAAGFPAGLVLLYLPMIGVRQSVRRAKAQALARLDEAIEHAGRDLEPEPLRYLGDLLHQRDAIRTGREWPLDTTAVSWIAFYVVIPPIAWVAGAIVEVLVESAL